MPELARTGAVTVLGSGTSITLQVVPLLRGLGGVVAAGSQLLLDGTGLVGTELSVLIDGRAAGTFSVRSIADVNLFNVGLAQQGQQLLSVTAPNGVGAGVITVVTSGGSFTLRSGVAVSATTQTPAADVGDTLAGAQALALAAGGRVTVSARTNDGTAALGLDVDLYQVSLATGDQLTIGLTGSNYSAARLLNAAGVEITSRLYNPTGTTPLVVTVPASGTYYVGVSGYGNVTYTPTTAGSGTVSQYPGTYQLVLERLGQGDSRIASITSTAAAGTPAQGAVASANTGQTITLTGAGFATGEAVLFSAIDSSGNRYWAQATAATVAGNGLSLTVVVPAEATTGTVRLARDPAGVLLQIVPRLTRVDTSAGQSYYGSTLSFTGTGFAEGATTVLWGATALADTSRRDGMDVTATAINLRTPDNSPTGPVRVVTVGGTSALVGPVFTGLSATATSGAGAVAGTASAVPGQTVTILGTGLETTTSVVFETIDIGGSRSQVLVRPTTVNAAGTSATVTVPISAVTGRVRVVGDQAAFEAALQIVPVITGVEVQSVAQDGSSALVVLSGLGFIEAGGTYLFGTTLVQDGSTGSGPDVYQGSPLFNLNGTVNVTVPLSDGAFGPIVASSAGGSSAAFTASIASIAGVALSGTPADAALASANPGQAVTLLGSNLSVTTDVLFRWTDISGNPRMTVLSPISAAANGTQATLVLPTYANGRASLQVFGSSSQPVLQIVPVLTSTSGGAGLTLKGRGMVEGGSTFTLPGASFVDTVVNAGADITYSDPFYIENDTAYLPAMAYGQGSVSVTTAGGTSAALALNAFNPSLGRLTDVAVDAASGAVWVVNYDNPGHLVRVNPATGATLSDIAMTNAFGLPYSYYGIGLQVVPTAFVLNATSVPAGSLLVFNGATSPDNVVAVDPSTGNVIATLSFPANYEATGGLYDAATGHLFLLDRRVAPTRLVEVNAQTGAQIASFDLAFNSNSESGLALHPTTGTLWYGSENSGTVVEMTRAGVVLRTLDITLQGAPSATGLSFDTAGRLLVSAANGVVYRIDTGFDPAQTRATLTSVTALATDGTAAAAGVASANVGQVIELVGTNFGPGTQVVFGTRDNAGVLGLIGQTPLGISAAGTRLQVIVPDLARTGDIYVVNTATRNLGFHGSYADAIYRQVTVSWTPASSTSVLRFGDLGLEGLDNESWGLDNVRVAQGGTSVFTDGFEGGAATGWSLPATTADLAGTFTQFSGRFSNATQTLSLAGLAAGQAATLTFDLYVLDSWDGNYPNSNAGPDVFQVSADGQVLLSEAFVNFGTQLSTQSYGRSAGVRLQVVPTLTATGQFGSDGSVSLTGSGFQEAASTVTVGGVALVDRFVNQSEGDVTGTRNDSYRLTLPLVVEGPVRVTTEGGTATLAGPLFGVQPVSQFTAIQASAAAGAPTDATRPSANVGQSIVLTGQGFTSSTLVQFSGVDDTGAAGSITRTGTVGSGGTTLTLVVPELARTGAVTVLGSGTSVTLQVVPLLRGLGGTVTEGNQVHIDGTGLVAAELSVMVDGVTAGTFSVQTVADVNPFSVSSPQQGQQRLIVTVPAATGAGVVTVTTSGGSFVLRRGVVVGSATSSPALDVGDTLATSLSATLATGSRIVVNARTNDGATATGLDVDLYQITLGAGDQLTLGMTGSNYTAVRLLDAAGVEIAERQFNPTGTSPLVVSAPASGTYYIGVSGYGNLSYTSTTSGSGTVSQYTGTYQLTAERLGTGDSRLSEMTATAAVGVPGANGIPSANTGQTITLTGVGFVTGEPVLFSAIDGNGDRYWAQVAGTVAGNGLSLTVVVPAEATTGTVRLARDPAGLYLQIVPRLTRVDASAGQTYDGSTLSFTGTGFAEGGTTVLWGATALADTSRRDGMAVTATAISLRTPENAPTGPVRVVTLGGTSNVLGTVFSGLTASAASGTAADGAIASAVPGQTITIVGSGLETTTSVVFETIDVSGSRSQVLVRPATVNGAGTSATVVVPVSARTGAVRVVGDQTALEAPLQIVPVITGVEVSSVASDGSSAVVNLTGLGFVEGGGRYVFGSTVVGDPGAGTGPDVYAGPPVFNANGTVNVTVPITAGAFGPITASSAGGTSAAFTATLASITATAASGTPADAALASANPGQTITLVGARLTTTTDVLFRWTDISGNPRMTVLVPATVTADGTSATVVLPTYANGRASLQVFGSSSQPVLQIVPVLTSVVPGTSGTTLKGLGMVEGATTFSLPGASFVDTVVNAGADITYSDPNYIENDTAFLPPMTYGNGVVTVTTTGGTSAALALAAFNPGFGTLMDVASDAAGDAWVITYADPGKLVKVDPDTGATLKSITFTSAEFGQSYTYYGSGLQVAPASFTLGTTTVPAGSVLVFNGNPANDRVIAVDPTTGAVLASLTVATNYDTTGGLFDPTSGHLFMLDRRASPTRLVEVNAATGAQIATLNLPTGVNEAGLALHPTTGNFWFAGQNNGDNLMEISRTGTVLRTIDLAAQGATANRVTGLSFASATKVLVSTDYGVVFEITV